MSFQIREDERRKRVENDTSAHEIRYRVKFHRLTSGSSSQTTRHDRIPSLSTLLCFQPATPRRALVSPSSLATVWKDLLPRRWDFLVSSHGFPRFSDLLTRVYARPEITDKLDGIKFLPLEKNRRRKEIRRWNILENPAEILLYRKLSDHWNSFHLG